MLLGPIEKRSFVNTKLYSNLRQAVSVLPQPNDLLAEHWMVGCWPAYWALEEIHVRERGNAIYLLLPDA